MEQDIRWQQRFSNFDKALHKLSQAVKYIQENFEPRESPSEEDSSKTVRDEIVAEGLIQRFEYTHELAWNVMKDYAVYQGNNNISGSRDATREAFQMKLISDGEVWMDMMLSRNKTSRTYNQEIAREIYAKILKSYYSAFLEFHKCMAAKKSPSKN